MRRLAPSCSLALLLLGCVTTNPPYQLLAAGPEGRGMNTYTDKCAEDPFVVGCRAPPGEESTMPMEPENAPGRVEPKPRATNAEPTPEGPQKAPEASPKEAPWYKRAVRKLWPAAGAGTKDTPKDQPNQAQEPARQEPSPAPRREIIQKWGGPEEIPRDPRLPPPAPSKQPTKDATKAASKDDRTPAWKQECIDTYEKCKVFKWKGDCYACFRFCEGQHEWPIDDCYPPWEKGWRRQVHGQ